FSRHTLTSLWEVGFTTRIPIYHADGTYLAKVVGSQLHLTKDGEKTGLRLLHPQGRTVCDLDGRTLFEIHRQEAAALKTHAELFTPDGYLVKCTDRSSRSLFSWRGLLEPWGNNDVWMHYPGLQDWPLAPQGWLS